MDFFLIICGALCLLLVAFYLLYQRVGIISQLSVLKSANQGISIKNSELEITIKEQIDIISNLQRIVAVLETEKKSSLFYQDNLEKRFENLASKIFENNNSKFHSDSLANIKNLLDPLKGKISDFEKRVTDSFNSDIKERYSLIKEISKMTLQSEKMIQETASLSKTLRGDNKAQGAWGELILSKVLEHSGLQNGRDYTFQQRLDEGKIIPDVIINLPEKKHLIIDAKTSLKHYDLYINSDNEEYLKHFLQSIKEHIRNLSGKQYHQDSQLLNPGFIFMFIPIESAYSLALMHDLELKNFALKRNIIIVSPNSLIAMLQTVASLWRIAEQNKNAAEIAYKAGMMYDKFVGFIEDLKKIGSSLLQVDKSYNDALAKLKSGRGNIIKRAEELKLMGAKANKQIGEDLL